MTTKIYTKAEAIESGLITKKKLLVNTKTTNGVLQVESIVGLIGGDEIQFDLDGTNPTPTENSIETSQKYDITYNSLDT